MENLSSNVDFGGYIDEDRLTYSVLKAVTNPEVEMTNLIAERNRIDRYIELCKEMIREDQERLKRAFEEGGVPPDAEYPEYVDAERLTYLTPIDGSSTLDSLFLKYTETKNEDTSIPPIQELDLNTEYNKPEQ